MKFTKMHGCGNDYVYVDCFHETVDNPEAVAKFVSNRHFGVGSDGLILICPSKVADVEMVMFNADGSRGEMCGNGIRCVGKYAYDFGLVKKEEITVETLAGIKTLKLILKDGKVDRVRVDMGAPIFDARWKDLSCDLFVHGKPSLHYIFGSGYKTAGFGKNRTEV